MRRIGILQGARLASKRVPRKLLEVVGGERLIDRGLRLLRAVQAATGASPFLALWAGDRELWDAAAAQQIEVVEISREAVEAEEWQDAFAGLADKLAHRFDWIVDANFLCRPFLTADTAQRIVQRAAVANQPFVCTCTHRGLLWNEYGKQIHGWHQTANTKRNPVYHDLAHLGYGFPTAMLADEAAASQAVPFPVALHWWEKIDVDTPDDLDFARSVARYMDARIIR